MTQDDLASAAGVSRRWLAALEHGKPGAELGLVLRVLAALGIELSTTPAQAARDLVDLDELVAGFERGDG